MYVEERLFKGDGHDSFGHSATPWENAIILVKTFCPFVIQDELSFFHYKSIFKILVKIFRRILE